MNQLLQGDCLEVMRGLPDQSIGLVLADLPYGVTACHWDKVIDLAAMWVQFKRLIQPKRALVFTATQPFTTDLICSNREWFRYSLVWDKVNASSGLHAKAQPLRAHEDVIVFGPSLPDYYPQMQRPNRPRTDKARFIPNGSAFNSKSVCRTYSNDEGNYPKSILPLSNAHQFGKIHPTQKPVALFEYLIRTYTNPGDLVLDPTAGSMTTAIAAMNTGRGYVCIEKDPDEYHKGLVRVEAHLAKPVQFNLLEPTPALPAKIEQGSLFALGGF